MMAPTQENTERRSQLRRLDDLLEALEQMNLREASELTERLRESLTLHGIPVEDGVEARVLIERVWRRQENHMIAARPDRRQTPSRRSGAHRPPGHDVIEGIIRQASQGSSQD